ncbi:hypothetical protein BV22DRAFT_1066600 [Leucogyrophana mollusca]|uniref:Uncharacterized protein n=1 Tax=Leucogyrophana mollusca TaxID=85980 RepID=A0ACB8BGX7_9AGAM|nr:hypothetical protein BV22DRAFT_1066600 [Leucogyrophana mollusca]
MPLVKIPFVFASTFALSSSIARPNPPSDVSERAKGPFYEHFLPLLPMALRTIVWIPCIAEGATILAENYPSPTSPKILSALLQNGRLPSFTLDRYVVAGTAMTILGSLARIWSIRTLGRHFTHELSIKKEHTLVTTGPYGIVRHPGYTAGVVAAVGLTIVHASPGSFIRACGWLDSWVGKTLVAFWMLQFLFGGAAVIVRTKIEDGYLREHFGDEGERYAQRVRYRLVPGVL